MVKSSSGDSSVSVHAVRSSNGGLNVLLINKSPQNAAEVSLSYAGFTPAAGAVTTVSHAKEGTTLTTAERGTAVAQTLPPYSITTLQLKPASKTPGADKPSPVPTPTAATPTAATPVVSASGTTGTRAQAEKAYPSATRARARAARPAAWLPPGEATLSRTAPSVACWPSLPEASWCFADVAAGLCTGSETA